MDALRDLRNEVRLAVDHSGLTARSHEHDLDKWYSPMNAFLSIGPPAYRIEQMLALVRAGVLELIGPGMTVGTRPELPAFVCESPQVPGSQRLATAMIEARLHHVDLSRAADPVLRRLVDDGSCVSHVLSDPDGSTYRTGGVAITRRPFHMRQSDGGAHPRRFVFGVPTEGVHWATAAGARPGVNSVLLGDSDALSGAILRLNPIPRPKVVFTYVPRRGAAVSG